MYNLIDVSGTILDCYKQMRWIRLQPLPKRNTLCNTIQQCLTRIDLTFPGAYKVLCFALLEARMVSLAMFWLLLCSAHRAARLGRQTPLLGYLVVSKGLGGTPADQRDIWCHMTTCSAIKAGGKEGGRGGIRSYMMFVFPNNELLCVLMPCLSGSGWATAWWWEIETSFPLFALIPHSASAFIIKLPFSQSMSLSILMSLSVVLRRGIEREPGWGSGS